LQHSAYTRYITQTTPTQDDLSLMKQRLSTFDDLPTISVLLVISDSDEIWIKATVSSVLNGIYPQKGVIAPGADADLILIDPQEQRTVSPTLLHMATDYSPYDGRELVGWASTVIVGGQVVLEGGAFAVDPPSGRPLESGPIPQEHLVC